MFQSIRVNICFCENRAYQILSLTSNENITHRLKVKNSFYNIWVTQIRTTRWSLIFRVKFYSEKFRKYKYTRLLNDSYTFYRTKLQRYKLLEMEVIAGTKRVYKIIDYKCIKITSEILTFFFYFLVWNEFSLLNFTDVTLHTVTSTPITTNYSAYTPVVAFNSDSLKRDFIR